MANSLPETRSPGKPEFTLSAIPTPASDLATLGIARLSFMQTGEEMPRFTPEITALFRVSVITGIIHHAPKEQNEGLGKKDKSSQLPSLARGNMRNRIHDAVQINH